jgi:hypothetical protein
MQRLIILARLGAIILFLCLPPLWVGAGLFGVRGACCGVITALIGMVIVASLAERSVSRAHFAGKNIPKGLSRTLAIAMEGQPGKVPHILIFADPSPNALLIRSLGGRGTILLSQGLIALLSEEELRSVLRLCVSRIREPGIVLQSFCCTLVVWALNFAPYAWVNLVFEGRELSSSDERFLGPFSALGFLVLFPAVRFFITFGRPPLRNQQPIGLGGTYSSAVQKITQAVHIWGPSKNHGAVSLYFVDPGAGKMLFPYN